MFWQCGLLLVGINLIVRVSAAPQGPLLGGPIVNAPPEPYHYNYKVENPPTNTFFGHTENGDPAVGRVSGSYYVFLPDGRTMTVEYYVDGESGYVPKISFQQTGPGGPRV